MADDFQGRFSHITDPNLRTYMENQYTSAGSPTGGWTADTSGYTPPSSGSSDIRDSITGVNNSIASLNSIPTTPNNTAFNFANYQGQINNAMALSTQDETDISNAGTGIAAQYDNLIRQAQNEKKQGMGKATVGAGELGGFMNTQFAGQAALTPTEGGTFVGAGGQLENTKSAYDLNISNLENQKITAVEAAKSAARQAKLTGKRSDIDLAMKMYDQAKAASSELFSQQMQKANYLINRSQEERASREDTGKNLAQSIISKLTSNTSENENLIKQYALQYGMDYNVLDSYVQQAKQEDNQTKISLAQNYQSIASNVAKGKTYTIPGTDITVTGTKDPETVEIEKESGGHKWKIRYDLSNPKSPVELFKIDLGTVKTSGGSGSGNSDEKAFYSDIAKMTDDLSAGKKNWGQAFNYLKAKYGAPDDVIDQLLDKETWSKAGAFETQKESRK